MRRPRLWGPTLFGFVSFIGFAAAADVCPVGESQLSAGEPCIPELLVQYLYCLQKSGYGKIETSEKRISDGTQSLSVKVGGALSGTIVKGSANVQYSTSDSAKVATEIQTKLNPDLAARCESVVLALRKAADPRTHPSRGLLSLLENSRFSAKSTQQLQMIDNCNVVAKITRTLSIGPTMGGSHLEGSYITVSTKQIIPAPNAIRVIPPPGYTPPYDPTETCEQKAIRVYGQDWSVSYGLQITPRSASSSSFAVIETVQKSSNVSNRHVNQKVSDTAFLENNRQVLRMENEQISLQSDP